MVFRFTYHGKVLGQARPRFARGHAYDTPQCSAYKRLLREIYKAQGGPAFDGAVSVTIDIARALPAGLVKKGMTSQIDTLRPDVDNLAKPVLDALNGLAYKDDSQVVSLTIRKFPRVATDSDSLRVTIADVANDMVYQKIDGA